MANGTCFGSNLIMSSHAYPIWIINQAQSVRLHWLMLSPCRSQWSAVRFWPVYRSSIAGLYWVSRRGGIIELDAIFTCNEVRLIKVEEVLRVRPPRSPILLLRSVSSRRLDRLVVRRFRFDELAVSLLLKVKECEICQCGRCSEGFAARIADFTTI